MLDDELVDELNIEADMLPRMAQLYDFVARNDDPPSYEVMITLLQTAFWSGVEVGLDKDYAWFRERMEQIRQHFQ